MEPTTTSGLPSDIAPGGTVMPAGGTSFEFDEAQNGVFRNVARNMSFVGMIYLVLGALMGFGGVITIASGDVAKGLSPALQAAFFVPVGLWTRRAAQAASAVAETRGNDIGHLMIAMEELKRVYGLQRALLIGLFLLFGAVIVVALAAGLSGARPQ